MQLPILTTSIKRHPTAPLPEFRAVQLEDQEAFDSIDDAVIVWLRETDRSLVAELENPFLGDGAPDALIQGAKRCHGHGASINRSDQDIPTMLPQAGAIANALNPTTPASVRATPILGFELAWF